MKKTDVKVENNAIVASFDKNEDGEKSVTVKVNLGEALGEAFSKGEAQVDAKKITVKMELTKLKIAVDTDQDGEPLIEAEIDLAEAIDEAKDTFVK